MKLNSLVAQIICAPNFDHFSTLEVRSAYLTLNSDKSIEPSEARRFVYSELLKLLKKGWLRKSTSKKKALTTFVKTDEFDPNGIIVSKKEPESANQGAVDDPIETIGDKLVERLASYKNDLLSGLGEAEEYKRLCKQFPDLHSTLQPKYNQVREHNSKLLGSIKAIENLTSVKQ